MGLTFWQPMFAKCHNLIRPRVVSWLIAEESSSGIEERMRERHVEIYSAEKLKTVKLHGSGGRQLQGGVVWPLRISGAASCKRGGVVLFRVG